MITDGALTDKVAEKLGVLPRGWNGSELSVYSNSGKAWYASLKVKKSNSHVCWLCFGKAEAPSRIRPIKSMREFGGEREKRERSIDVVSAALAESLLADVQGVILR